MNAGSVNKVWQISKRLLYQNRWIYLLLMLWPPSIDSNRRLEMAPPFGEILSV